MDYAIIKAANTDLLEVVKLTDWNDYEWDDFTTVKSKEDNRIVWFEYKDTAVLFMLDKFTHEMINPKYFKDTSNCGDYYLD